MATSDQEIYFFVLLGFLLMVLMSSFIIFMAFAHRQRQQRAKERMTAIQMEFEKTLRDVEKEIREETLSFVGRELHDNVGQLLSLAKLNLASSKPERVQEGKQLINKIINEVRGLSKVLNLEWLDGYSLEDFIQNELARLEQVDFCKTSFQSNVSNLEITKEQKIILIRVIQECLNNAIKHASPSKISVEILDEGVQSVIKISDNGRGFTKESTKSSSGLINLEKRMHTIGGKLFIDSKLDLGTSITLILPTN